MKKATIITVAFFILAAAAVIVFAPKKERFVSEKRFQMATWTMITLPEGKDNARAFKEAFEAIDEVERAFSRFIPDSEINLLNKSAGKDWRRLSPLFLPAWEKAEELYKLSRGRFDVTAGQLISLWGFGPEGKRKTPSEEEIKKALAVTGFDKLMRSNDWIMLPEGMKLDLNALAAGYAADRAASVLRQLGYDVFLVDAGGEIVASGKDHSWAIGIRDPLGKDAAAIYESLKLQNFAVSTSGSYSNNLKEGEVRFTHIVDPVSGGTFMNSLLSVSVTASDAMTADGFSTLLFCLPPEEGLKLAEETEGIEALFLIDKGGALERKATAGWVKSFEK
ncbi:FAD:protein FMN transferase [bacterium]|nr:FAD:protein FMN transferase [bacterium]